jgi:hypothetical protein
MAVCAFDDPSNHSLRMPSPWSEGDGIGQNPVTEGDPRIGGRHRRRCGRQKSIGQNGRVALPADKLAATWNIRTHGDYGSRWISAASGAGDDLQNVTARRRGALGIDTDISSGGDRCVKEGLEVAVKSSVKGIA